METKTDKNSERNWHTIDIKGRVLGRVATEIADLLRGKKKVDFMLNIDRGDFVIALNADQFILTGKKEEQKRYYKHTGYLGNMKTYTVGDKKTGQCGEVLRIAVLGMLPKNRLQKGFINRLKTYAGTEHPHINAKIKSKEA